MLKHGKFIILILTICLFSTVNAAELNFNRIIFFGDSLTDNGNFYQTSFKLIPNSPPYYQGRFSNGKTWAEGVAAYYQQFNVQSTNNAVAKQTAQPNTFFTSLSGTVGKYLKSIQALNAANTLFVIWIGGNDYMDGAPQVGPYTSTTVNEIKLNIEKLMAIGGRHFVIMNLPDLSSVPRGANSALASNLKSLTLEHNRKLESILINLRVTHPQANIQLFDMYKEFSQITQNPVEYNEKYHSHLSNTSESCFKGGYFLNRNIEDQRTLVSDIEEHMQLPTAQARQFARGIQESAVLTTSYDAAKSFERGAAKQCSDPDSYLFWDEIHPSAAAHTIFSMMMIDFINLHFRHQV